MAPKIRKYDIFLCLWLFLIFGGFSPSFVLASEVGENGGGQGQGAGAPEEKENFTLRRHAFDNMEDCLDNFKIPYHAACNVTKFTLVDWTLRHKHEIQDGRIGLSHVENVTLKERTELASLECFRHSLCYKGKCDCTKGIHPICNGTQNKAKVDNCQGQYDVILKLKNNRTEKGNETYHQFLKTSKELEECLENFKIPLYKSCDLEARIRYEDIIKFRRNEFDYGHLSLTEKKEMAGLICISPSICHRGMCNCTPAIVNCTTKLQNKGASCDQENSAYLQASIAYGFSQPEAPPKPKSNNVTKKEKQEREVFQWFLSSRREMEVCLENFNIRYNDTCDQAGLMKKIKETAALGKPSFANQKEIAGLTCLSPSTCVKGNCTCSPESGPCDPKPANEDATCRKESSACQGASDALETIVRGPRPTGGGGGGGGGGGKALAPPRGGGKKAAAAVAAAKTTRTPPGGKSGTGPNGGADGPNGTAGAGQGQGGPDGTDGGPPEPPIPGTGPNGTNDIPVMFPDPDEPDIPGMNCSGGASQIELAKLNLTKEQKKEIEADRQVRNTTKGLEVCFHNFQIPYNEPCSLEKFQHVYRKLVTTSRSNMAHYDQKTALKDRTALENTRCLFPSECSTSEEICICDPKIWSADCDEKTQNKKVTCEVEYSAFRQAAFMAYNVSMNKTTGGADALWKTDGGHFGIYVAAAAGLFLNWGK